MATPFLALNNRTATTPQVRRYINGTPSTQGVTFGSLDNNTGLGTPNDLLCKCNPIQFLGANTFLAVVGGVIYRSTDAGASWTSVRTLTNMVATTQSINSGFHILFDGNGVANAVLLYRGSGAQWNAEYSSNGTSWTNVTGTAAESFLSTAGILDSVIFNGKLTCLTIGTSTSTTAIFDMASASFSFVSSASPAGTSWSLSAALCQFNGKLYGMWYNNNGASTAFKLRELQGTVWTEVTSFSASSTTLLDGQVKFGMFTDNTYMYIFYIDTLATTRTWTVKRVDSTNTVTDISSTVLPAAMTSGNPTTTSRVGILTDAESNPGGTPNFCVYNANGGAAGDAWNVWQWNGNAATMTLLDTGGSGAHAMPFEHESNGDYFWTSGDAYVEMVLKTVVAGGVRYSFKLYNDAITGTVSVTNGLATVVGTGTSFTTQLTAGMQLEFASQTGTYYTILSITDNLNLTLTAAYTGSTNASTSATRAVGIKGFYGTSTTPWPNSPATLSNPSVGTLSGSGAGNSILALPADNGTTTYQVTWMASSNGFVSGQRAKFQLEQT